MLSSTTSSSTTPEPPVPEDPQWSEDTSSSTGLRRFSPTLAVCIAAGLAAGIGLARPGLTDSTATQTLQSQPAVSAGARRPGGYLGGAGASGGGAPQVDAAPPAAQIQISDFEFSPVSAGPGQLITVLNSDGVAHTVTAEADSFDTGNISGGSAAQFAAPTAPGTYEFICTIHPSMHGSLVVSQ